MRNWTDEAEVLEFFDESDSIDAEIKIVVDLMSAVENYEHEDRLLMRIGGFLSSKLEKRRQLQNEFTKKLFDKDA